MVEFKANVPLFIRDKDWKTLKQTLGGFDHLELAGLIEEISEGEEIILFRLLSRDQAKEVFQLLTRDKQEQIIEGLAQNVQTLSELLNDLEPDDRTAFFEELPGQVAQRLIQHLNPGEREISIQLLGYPKDSIGRLMTPEYVAVKAGYTVEHALDHIRRHGHDSETLNVIYIIDSSWRLLDDIRIKELILASPAQRIEELMDNRFVALNVMDDQETAVKMFKDYDRVALPVVNDEGILLGIVTFDDIMDVVDEESTEDFHKFGSFPSAITNPLKETAFNLAKYRIPWLIALVFVNIFSSGALSAYESVIESMVSLVFFLPLLIGSGGNAGSQAATLMIRSLVVGDVKLFHWYRLLGKEIIVSFILGGLMAIGVAMIATVRAPEIVVVVAFTMVLVVMTGSLIGLMLPFIFTKIKLDPATASAPLITSITDIAGVVIYFSIARWYLGL